MNERVTIRKNFQRLDYQIKIVSVFTASSNSFNMRVRSDPFSIQNKVLRLVGMRGSCTYFVTGNGSYTNQECEFFVYQNTAAVFDTSDKLVSNPPVIPLTGLTPAVTTPMANATSTIVEEPNFAMWNSKWGIQDYSHIFTQSFTLQCNLLSAVQVATIGDQVSFRVWLTFEIIK